LPNTAHADRENIFESSPTKRRRLPSQITLFFARARVINNAQDKLVPTSFQGGFYFEIQVKERQRKVKPKKAISTRSAKACRV
jgi:hypothetical protein